MQKCCVLSEHKEQFACVNQDNGFIVKDELRGKMRLSTQTKRDFFSKDAGCWVEIRFHDIY